LTPFPASRRGLRRSLVAGAFYDAALGLFILIAGPGAMAALGHPVAGSSFFFRLAALPLLLLPWLYVAAARAEAIDLFRGSVLWVRGAGGLFVLLLAGFLRPAPLALFAAIGIVDLVFCALHALLWSAPRVDRVPG